MKVIIRLIKQFATPLHHYLPEYIVYTMLGIIFGLVNFTMLIPLLQLMFDVEDKAAPVRTLPEFSLSINYFSDLFGFYFTRIQENNGQLYALGFVCSIIAVCTLLANVFRYLAVRVLMRLRLNMLQRIRNSIFSKLMFQSPSFYQEKRKGELLSTMTNEVQEIESSLVNAIQSWLRDPFIIIVYFIGLFVISAKLTLFTIIFFPISGLSIAYITKQLKKLSWFSQDLLGKILTTTEESISNLKVIQSFVGQKFIVDKFTSVNKAFSDTSKKMFGKKELASPISEVLGVTVVIVLVMYGGYLNSTEGFDGAKFITYLVLYTQILQPLKNLSNTTTAVQRSMVAAEKVFSIIDAPVSITEQENAKALPNLSQKIEVRNLSFSYGGATVLSNINLTIEKGKTVALVGESGSGKSTLADLFPRFIDPVKGEILIDGIDIKQAKLDDLRGQIAFVSQEAVLFHDTIFNNIAFGQPSSDMDKVINAAKIANAHRFIEESENGYDTIIGDRGMKLSGGQRQRLTIARAIFKDAPILILDEATSALDTESERLVQQAINELMKNRTSLVIAHRLSTIRHADEIIVMHKGEIVERGNHETLIEKNGYYKRLVDLQEVK